MEFIDTETFLLFGECNSKILNLQLNSYLISRLHIMKTLPIFGMTEWLYLTLLQSGRNVKVIEPREGSKFHNIWSAWFLLSESYLPSQNVKWGWTSRTHKKFYKILTLGSFYKTHCEAQAQMPGTERLCFLCSGYTVVMFTCCFLNSMLMWCKMY